MRFPKNLKNKILEKIKPEELYDELINTVYKEKT